jgi:lipopolysaccharide transport system permease protein
MQQYAWLTWEMSKREIMQRYRGTLLGLLWPILYGVLLLAVFSFVFIKLLQVRWGGGGEGGPAFGTLMIFSGLVPYLFVADVISRSPGYVTGMAHLVKRVRFPVQLIPLIQANAALFLLSVNLVLLLAFAAVTTGISLATILACIAITAVMYLFSLGLAWLFSSVGVFFQDLAQFTPVAVQVLLFWRRSSIPWRRSPRAFARMWRSILSPITRRRFGEPSSVMAPWIGDFG